MKANRAPTGFPVVCVGGSAGGLDAYQQLLRHLPPDLGAAVVIVNHLRTVATRLPEILPQYTKMPVEKITDRLRIQPNRVFIIPEQRDLHVEQGEFRLKPISKPRGWPDVITVFLDSLAEHWSGKLIAVIVSGYDGDGAAGLCGIREVGGITIAQEPETAAQPDMPKSAIASGCIDFVLSPEDIAHKIAQIAQTPAPGRLLPRTIVIGTLHYGEHGGRQELPVSVVVRNGEYFEPGSDTYLTPLGLQVEKICTDSAAEAVRSLASRRIREIMWAPAEFALAPTRDLLQQLTGVVVSDARRTSSGIA